MCRAKDDKFRVKLVGLERRGIEGPGLTTTVRILESVVRKFKTWETLSKRSSDCLERKDNLSRYNKRGALNGCTIESACPSMEVSKCLVDPIDHLIFLDARYSTRWRKLDTSIYMEPAIMSCITLTVKDSQ